MNAFTSSMSFLSSLVLLFHIFHWFWVLDELLLQNSKTMINGSIKMIILRFLPSVVDSLCGETVYIFVHCSSLSNFPSKMSNFVTTNSTKHIDLFLYEKE
jgi:hypothetical protein